MKTETRDGMRIDWDTPIAMDDGLILRADVFRPLDDGHYPAILSYGPYAKGLAFQDGYKSNWERLIKAAPEVLAGSSNKYQVWELVDPEKWVPDGYACVRVDSRGAGARQAILISGRRAKRRISISASNGQERSRGATAKSVSTAFPISRPTSGRSPRYARRISLQSASGKVLRIITANSRAMAEY